MVESKCSIYDLDVAPLVPVVSIDETNETDGDWILRVNDAVPVPVVDTSGDSFGFAVDSSTCSSFSSMSHAETAVVQLHEPDAILQAEIYSPVSSLLFGSVIGIERQDDDSSVTAIESNWTRNYSDSSSFASNPDERISCHQLASSPLFHPTTSPCATGDCCQPSCNGCVVGSVRAALDLSDVMNPIREIVQQQQIQYEQVSQHRNDVDRRREMMVASGVASAALGMLLCGPIGAILFGFGAAYAAEHKPEGDGVGDSARAIGEIALTVADSVQKVRDKYWALRRIEHEQMLANNICYANGRSGRINIDEILRRHNRTILMKQTAGFVVKCSWRATTKFVEKHKILEKGLNSIGMSVCWVAEKIVKHCNRFHERASFQANT